MRIFTPVDEAILHQLGHFKYLTLAQLVKLGVGERSYVSTRLKKLRVDGFVGVSEYGGVYKKGHGRAENINYLLPKGAKLLVENSKGLDIGQVHYPKNIDGIFRNDYLHRISTVNSQIACEQWLNQQGYPLIFFDTYFHKLGSSKKAKDNNPLRSITRVTFADGTFIEPDAVFAYDMPTKRQMMVLECQNGTDTTRHVSQLKKLAHVLAQGLITEHYKEQYDIQTNPRILVTLETEDMLRLVLKRIQADPFFAPAWMGKAFFFQVAESVWQGFGSGWLNIHGEQVDLLDFS